MFALKKILFLSSLVLLTGCAGMGWVHPSKNQSALYQDEMECRMQSNMIYPPIILSQNVSQYDTHCTDDDNNGKHCSMRAQGGGQYDANASDRKRAVYGCLKARGWQWSWGN